MELQHVWLTGDLGYATYHDFRKDHGGLSINAIESIYEAGELTIGVF